MKNKVVTREEWRIQRIAFLEKEKAFTKLRDELSEERRTLPWVKIEKEYEFDTVKGKKNLSELFDNNQQLVMYHFMYGPDDSGPCKHCSFWADNFNFLPKHLNQRDTTFIAVSRGELDNLIAMKQRMNWSFEWVSSFNSDFNEDVEVTFYPGKFNEYNYKKFVVEQTTERPGISVFYKSEDGSVYHTYSCFARELETFNTAYRYLDIVPKGRNEKELPFPMAWVKFRDKY